MSPCPLCEGNGELPQELVTALLRALVKKRSGPSAGLWHVRLRTGEIVEARILSQAEVDLLGLAISPTSPP